MGIEGLNGKDQKMVMNLRVNRQSFFVRSVVSILVILISLIWVMAKFEPLTDHVESELALARDVVGCEKEFEAQHVTWPELVEESKCYPGWKLRELMGGERVSQIGENFQSQKYLDLIKVSLIALFASLLVQWLLALAVRAATLVF